MSNSITITPAELKYSEAIKDILLSEKLPTPDIPSDLKNFYVATDNGFVIGCIGLEIYDNYGLLRSMAVKPEYRRMKIASELIKRIESLARQSGLRSIYLLTETTSGYFEKKGFTGTKREEVPTPLQQSSEFSHTCPQSAIAMVKRIQ